MGVSKHPPQRAYRYFDLIMAVFVTILLCSNLIGAAKILTVFGVVTSGSILFFPISYLFGDILTEVYGYARSRRVVWTGFAALLFASLVSFVVLNLPPAEGWNHQSELEIIFGQTPRLAGASLIAYFLGEISNSYVLAKMKIWTQGRWLWTRVVGSTIAGEAIDTILFYPLAFYGVWSNPLLGRIMVTNYLIKVIWELVMTPFTYRIVSFLKRAENEDFYDYDTNFSPFSFKL
ncbi:MAG: queuosine precursor transporter [Bdellovibrio sp.]|nr:queuosine precursor transporter [Bdellovibrio sp.]